MRRPVPVPPLPELRARGDRELTAESEGAYYLKPWSFRTTRTTCRATTTRLWGRGRRTRTKSPSPSTPSGSSSSNRPKSFGKATQKRSRELSTQRPRRMRRRCGRRSRKLTKRWTSGSKEWRKGCKNTGTTSRSSETRARRGSP